jgi:hypothetical protein
MEQPTNNTNTAKEALATKFAHIIGWGIDADPKNEPTYPMKHYTGDDHNRLNWNRPSLQPETVEILMSTEYPRMPAVFGTSIPPSGLSGAIRRMAFHYSEDRLRHWIPLVLADKINIIEGMLEDLMHGHFPNMYAEKGWGAEWKYNRKGSVIKLVAGVAVVAAVTGLLIYRNSRNSGVAEER